MLTAIVTHETQGINPFDLLTSDERKEYDAWSDEVNIGTRDPEPSDMEISYRELTEQDAYKEATLGRWKVIPMDDLQVERDYHLLVDAGWIERPRPHRVRNGVSQLLYARVNPHAVLFWRDFTATPPRPVKTALDNGSDNYRWGNAFIYFKYESDAQAYRSHIKAQERQAQDARFEQTGVWL